MFKNASNQRKRWLGATALAAVALVAGSAAFFVARSVGDGSEVQAGEVLGVQTAVPTQVSWPPYPAGKGPGKGPNYIDPPGREVTPIAGATPDTSQPWWYVPYQNADEVKPLFQGRVNGIVVSLDPAPEGVCGQYSNAELTAAEGTGVRIDLTYMPPKSSSSPPSGGPVVLCDGHPIAAEARFEVAPDESQGVYGGSFAICRYQSEVAWAQAFGPADRWSAGNVDGIPAAILAPILPDIGYGNSAIAFFSGGIMTRVTADGLPLKQVYQIAEGLVR